MTTSRVVLVGFMGAGKSRVGRALARLMRVAFADLDETLEQESGLSIAAWFRTRGEAAFREAEAEHLERWFESGDGVLATGGGIVESSRALAIVRGHFPVVWLDPPYDELRERIARSTREPRPLLAELGWEGLEARRDLRRPLYAACADFRFQESASSAHAMALRVHRVLAEALGP